MSIRTEVEGIYENPIRCIYSKPCHSQNPKHDLDRNSVCECARHQRRSSLDE